MIRAAIHRPIAAAMFFLALVLVGVLSYKRLPVDLLPSITYPRLTVITTYQDLPAEDLERLVTRPLEEVVTALSGVRGITSRTREGVSTITVEYEWGTQMDFANLHLREAIDRVSFREDFPEGADRPAILRWDPTSRPVSILVLEGEGSLEALTDFAREVVKPALEQVDGISQAEVVGGADREILVRPDPEKLAIYDIDLEEIRQALARSNVNFPGGKVRLGPLHLSLRIDGEYESLDEIAVTDVSRSGRSSIKVSDVAEVLDTVKEPEGTTLLGARPVVSLLLYKEPEANTIGVAREVDKALGVVQGDYGDFQYDFVYRDADYVRASFTGLVDSLLLGAALAFLVLFFFLRDVRSPLVVGLAIPVSIFITFGLLYFGRVNLNLMSLGGLSLAAGMLVDNAIVVLENISRHLTGKGGKEGTADEETASDETLPPPASERVAARRVVAAAAERGTREMARPVIASTLTTIAVFFPVVYVPGIAGAFFRDQALTVTFSLAISVLAALLLQPVIASRVLAVREGPPRGIFRLFVRLFDRGHDAYHAALVRFLPHARAGLLALAAGLAVAFFIGSRLDRSLLPERTSGDMRLDLELPAGAPLEETIQFASTLGDELQHDHAVRHVFTQVGRTERTLAALQEYDAPNTARMRIILEPGRHAHREARRVQKELAARLEAIPGLHFTFREEGIGLGELLAAGGAPFAMGVVAEKPEEAVQAAEAVREKLGGVRGLTDLEVDRVLGTSTLVVRLNRDEILRSGLDPEAVARELRNRIAGVEATTFNEVEQRIDIAVRFPREVRRDLAQALSTPFEVPGGRTVPLRSFLTIHEERPVRELVRRNQRRMVTVSGQIAGRSLDDVWEDAQKAVRTLDLPREVNLVQGGERQEMTRSFRDLGMAMLLAVLLVYMILAAQFESFLDPFLIACVLPIGLAGSLLAIAVTGHTINILSMIGIVALLGIAVNDAIVKVDTIRRLREEGWEGYAAILEASRLRFRPILMTSVTTVMGMIPMAIGLGGGEQLQRPLAVTIIGGLTLTTVLTLFYTPLLYRIAHRILPGEGRGDAHGAAHGPAGAGPDATDRAEGAP